MIIKMKKMFAIAALLAIAWGASAQSSRWKGISVGADRDTLLYIIASPFDNWFLTIGGGAQTYIGNERIASARKNKLNYNLHLDVGKWVLPDLSVSARLGFANMDGQTGTFGKGMNFGKHPFVYVYNSESQLAKDADQPNENGYYSFHAHMAQLMGFVTLDWTNFLLGYEAGRQKWFHVYTPIGLGVSMLFGTQRNDSRGLLDDGHAKGDFRRNFELAFAAGLGFEYEMTPNFAINFSAELLGTRGSHDWSYVYREDAWNYYSIFDLMPSVNLGLRFNLFSEVTKYNPYTKSAQRSKVNHEFISFGTQRTVPSLTGRIQRLNARLDSLQTLSDSRTHHDSLLIAQLTAELNRLDTLQQSASEVVAPGTTTQPNIFDEIITLNQVLDLPSVILYFPLNGHTLNDVNRRKLQAFMSRIEDIRDTTEFYIIGAADAETGTPRINMRLSEQRCKAVHKHLVSHYEMYDSQLADAPMGGVAGYGERNRMSMIIVKTPAIQSIVERWRHSR